MLTSCVKWELVVGRTMAGGFGLVPHVELCERAGTRCLCLLGGNGSQLSLSRYSVQFPLWKVDPAFQLAFRPQWLWAAPRIAPEAALTVNSR